MEIKIVNMDEPIHRNKIALGFELSCINVDLSALKPLKPLRPQVKKTKKYQQIVASILSVGLVEPPVLLADEFDKSSFYILDGHLRIEALKDIGKSEAQCLVSHQDDTYTYNRRLIRISAAQSHRMITQAIAFGISEARMAEALGVNVVTVRKEIKLFDGICNEVREMLADKNCPRTVFGLLKEVTALRQIEAAELMIGNNNYTTAFMRAILAATPAKQILKKTTSKQTDQSVSELMARQEKELAALQMNIKVIEESFGEDTLLLTVTKNYLKKLLSNARIVLWLSQNHADYLSEFQTITEITSLPGEETRRMGA